jgi:hypothetical protein
MAGMSYFIKLTMILSLAYIYTAHEHRPPIPRYLYSGLLYEHIGFDNTATLVNPDEVSFQRVLDITSIAAAVGQLKNASIQFKHLCNEATSKIERQKLEAEINPGLEKYQKYIAPAQTTYLRNAKSLCQRNNAMLPEIKTLEDLTDISQVAKTYGIDIVPSNFYYEQNSQRIKYGSDGTEMADYRHLFSGYEYGGDYNRAWHRADHPNDATFRHQAHNYIIAFKHFEPTKVLVRILDNIEMDYQKRIICRVPQPIPKTIQQEGINSLISFVCKRDVQYYLNSTTIIYDTAEALFNVTDLIRKNELLKQQRKPDLETQTQSARQKREIKFDYNNPNFVPSVYGDKPYEKSFRLSQYQNLTDQLFHLPLKRQKRLAIIPMMALTGTAAVSTANMISSMQTGQPPLSWLGSGLGRIFGWASRDELQAHAEAILANTNTIDKLVINIEDISYQLESHRIAVQQLQQYISASENSMLTYFRITDLAQHLQLIMVNLQISITNVLALLSDTYAGQFTPSIISPNELYHLRARLITDRKITIDVDFKRIRTALVMTQSQYHIIITFNVIEDRDRADLYRVKSIPVFANGKAYKAEADAEYFALFRKDGDYTVLEPDEANYCQSNPINCRAKSLKNMYSPQSLCVIHTFKQ